MKLFGIILKLIGALGLASTSEEMNLLHNDVDKFDKEAYAELQKPEKEQKDKLKLMYAKLHEGVWFRLLAPFLYFFLLKEAKNIMSDKQDDYFDV